MYSLLLEPVTLDDDDRVVQWTATLKITGQDDVYLGMLNSRQEAMDIAREAARIREDEKRRLELMARLKETIPIEP